MMMLGSLAFSLKLLREGESVAKHCPHRTFRGLCWCGGGRSEIPLALVISHPCGYKFENNPLKTSNETCWANRVNLRLKRQLFLAI